MIHLTDMLKEAEGLHQLLVSTYHLDGQAAP
jgi:hypothetical protein